MDTQAKGIFPGFFENFGNGRMREADVVEFFSGADDKPGGSYVLSHGCANHGDAQYLIAALFANDPDFSGGFIVGEASAVCPEKSFADGNIDTFFDTFFLGPAY